MSYTKAEAKLEVGDSTDWIVGFDVSIKKWEQRASGELKAYDIGDSCGLCMVVDNKHGLCDSCPIDPCRNIIWGDAKDVLQYLKNEKEKYEKTLSENS